MKTKITLLSLISSLSGIVSALYLFGNKFTSICYPWLVGISYYWDEYNSASAVTILFNLIFLIGGIVYWQNQEKELRFLRFIFSIIFLSKILSSIVAILHFSLNISQFNFYYLNSILAGFAWIFVSYKILNYLNSKKNLQINQDIVDENLTYFVEAPLWKRFFNFCIDTIILILVFGYFFFLLYKTFSLRNSLDVGLAFIFIVIILFARISYYMIFELFFDSSPGKFLTETRVIKNDGNKIDAPTSFYKNLARYVPFEPYSFLFARVGWHDKWTDTTVVKEERTGKIGVYYFWSIPIFVIILTLAPIMMYSFAKYKSYLEIKGKKEDVYNELENKLENLKLNDFIFVFDESDYFNKIYLKPEKIEDAKIVFSAFKVKGNSRFDDIDVEVYYKQNKDSITRVVLTKQDLIKAIRIEGETTKPEKALSLYGHKELYTVAKVEPYFKANLKLMYANLNEYYKGAYNISISLVNKGWPAKISNLETIDNDEIKWSLERTSYVEKFDHIIIRGKSKTSVSEFKISFKTTDSLGRKQTYEIEKSIAQEDPIIKQIK